MKRRKMLLCVTVTSMAAAVGCQESVQPVGSVSQPHHSDAKDAAAPDTTATPDETAAPAVGTTAQVPDQKK